MKKVYLIAHNFLRDDLVANLQDKSLVHITDISQKQFEERREKEETLELTSQKGKEDLQAELDELSLSIDRVEFILDLLADYEEKKGFLASLIKEKVTTARRVFDQIEEKVTFDEIYEQCEDIDDNLSHLQNRITYLKNLKETLQDWSALKLEISSLKDTETVSVLIGSLSSENYSLLKNELEEQVKESLVEEVGRGRQEVNIFLIFHKSSQEKAGSLLSKFGFRQVTFPENTDTPTNEVKKISREIENLEKERKELIGQIRNLLSLKSDLLILYDWLENKKRRLEVQANFVQTKQAFMLEGWIEEGKVDDFKKEIAKVTPEADLTLLSPGPNEKPPVVLRNNPIIQPFEVLTKLFGLPDYHELDPTPFLAPFFFLFFGICLGDFGYGLILAVVSWLLAKNLQVSENVKKGFYLFAYGGIASMIVGIFTGGYFGVDVKLLPGFLKSLMLFNPLEDAKIFLVVSISLGVIHVCFGLILAGVNNIRNNNIADAIYDQLTTLLFLLCAVPTLVLWLWSIIAKPAPTWVSLYLSYFVSALGLAALGVIVFHGRLLNFCLAEIVKGLKALSSSQAAIQLFCASVSSVLVMSLAGWFVSPLLFKDLSSLFSKAVGISALLLITFCFFLKKMREHLGKWWGGVFSLYGMSSYIGDFLSYARLMALGLATTLIGGVVNYMFTISALRPLAMVIAVILTAVMAFLLRRWRQFSYAKAIAASIGLVSLGALAVTLVGMIVSLSFLKFVGLTILVAALVTVVVVFGHVFNLVINLIGCFVHPARLQFLEFFGQFYEDGGKKFKPFGLELKHLTFEK